MPIYEFVGCHPREEVVPVGTEEIPCTVCGELLTRIHKVYPNKTLGKVHSGMEELENALLGTSHRKGRQRFTSQSDVDSFLTANKLALMSEEENTKAAEQERFEDAQCRRVLREQGPEGLEAHVSKVDNSDVEGEVDAFIKELL